MTDSLSVRQTQILKALVEEYIETAIPAGSLALEKKYDLGISPATIRSELNQLTKMGYLRQPHTSAGRIPTSKAMKFYINQLMEEKEMSIADEVKSKEKVKDIKNDLDKLMREVTLALAQGTGGLAVAAISDGDVWRSGFGNVFDNPEFSDIDVCRNVFDLLEETRKLQELFFERLTGVSPVEVLFGEDLDWPYFNEIGIVGSRFSLNGHEGAIAVIGPLRSRYWSIIPIVRYFGDLIQSTNE